MKTPLEKYENDPEYRMLVDNFLSMIHYAKFTPSEIREAALFASIKYEMQTIRRNIIRDPELKKALDTLNNWAKDEQNLYI